MHFFGRLKKPLQRTVSFEKAAPLSIDECTTNRAVSDLCAHWRTTHRRKRRRGTPTSGSKRQKALWNPDEAQNEDDDDDDDFVM